MRVGIALLLALLFLSPLVMISGGNDVESATIGCELSFDGELANESVGFQTSLGPRLPGSAASSALRESIKSNLTGWDITESTHHADGMVLTNLYATWNKGAGSEVIFAAHYDTRAWGDKDPDVSRHDEPIDGANDGASGVAVLIELGRIIPTLNLTHEVTLFFTDGEDQGNDSTMSGWILGATAWADNLTQSEADQIESFILIDMIGDSDLTLRRAYPGNETLWNRTVDKIFFLDEVCGLGDSSYLNTQGFDMIIDDHVPADNLRIPAIDIIDARYGQNATDPIFGGHHHTHNDTADKVSAESLQKIGNILESGLITGSWLNVRVTDANEERGKVPEDIVNITDDVEEVEDDEDGMIIGILLMACILLVWGNLAWIIFADTRGEG